MPACYLTACIQFVLDARGPADIAYLVRDFTVWDEWDAIAGYEMQEYLERNFPFVRQ